MRCPFCGESNDHVINSRETKDSESIRRRRECKSCQKRWTTMEIIEKVPITLVKRDDRREEFDPQKLHRGLQRSCHKRKVRDQDIEQIVRYVERELQNTMDREVDSRRVGDLVLKRLRDLDEVAYLRFASVFYSYEDVSDFRDELSKLLKRQ